MTVPAPPAVRDAATVILLRESTRSQEPAPEVLLLRRHAGSGFAASAWVFPGGTLDPADRDLDPTLWRGADPEGLADVTGFPASTALGLCVAAVRETFEEAGLLLATHADGQAVDLGAPDVRTMRHALAGREGHGADFASWLGEAGLVLDLGALVPYARWITPVAEPRRYDTVFFLARAPLDQIADHDRVETTQSRWLTPADALQAHAAGDLALIYPTVRTLEDLAAAPTAEALLADATAQPRLRPLLPHMVTDAEGRVVAVLHPDDPDYPHDSYPSTPRDPPVTAA